MKPIAIKSQAQREMLERIAAGDHAEALRRGLSVELAKASLAGSPVARLPHRLGPERPARHAKLRG